MNRGSNRLKADGAAVAYIDEVLARASSPAPRSTKASSAFSILAPRPRARITTPLPMRWPQTMKMAPLFSGSALQSRRTMRVSVVNARTTAADVDLTIAAVARVLAAQGAALHPSTHRL